MQLYPLDDIELDTPYTSTHCYKEMPFRRRQNMKVISRFIKYGKAQLTAHFRLALLARGLE